MMKYKLTFYLILFSACFVHAQEVFYQDVFNGGVTGGGVSTCLGAGTGNIDVYIAPGSTIKKAFLFAYKIGSSSDYNGIKFDGQNIDLSVFTQITGDINNFVNEAPFYSIHAVDVTNSISVNQSSYPVKIPLQSSNLEECINCVYGAVYLYIEFKNNSLNKISTEIFTNKKPNIAITENNITNINPIDVTNDVGLALHTDRIANYQLYGDGTLISINNNNLGTIGGNDQIDNSWGCGVKGHFYYQNGIFTGLDDDTSNTQVDGPDGIANVQGLFNQNQTNFKIEFKYQTQNSLHLHTNYHLTYFLTHSTPCDTFSTSLNTTDTSLCRGDSVQLNVNGGNTSLSKDAYEWSPQTGLSCYNCPDPVATPDSSITYRVRIWNTDSCSKVLPVRVRVQDAVTFTTEKEGFLCGENTGQITFNAGGNNESYEYQVNNTTQTSPVFSNLPPGNTLLKVTAANGCSAEKIVNIEGENDVTAGYEAQPPEGEAPLSVWLNNTSTNSNFYDWHIEDDTLNEENPGISLDTIGVYPVKLIACKNEDQCCDTVQKNIVVQPEVSTFVPNIITPNGDGKNDRFRAEIKGAQEATLQIYNRWGNPLGQDQSKAKLTEEGYYLELYWNGQYKGQTAPDGVYTYTIRYIDWRGEEQRKAGSFHLAQ